MPRPLFVVTFDVVTPESAEQGDVAAAGFIRRDYGTGAEDLRALHPPRGITPSSYARISRLLRAD